MKIINKFLNFLFPEKCSWCWKYWNNLCKNCLENFSEREKKFFDIKNFEKIYSPFFYYKNTILKKILKEIKYKNKFSKFSGLEEKIFFEFKKFLESIWCTDVASQRPYGFWENIYLIPIPLHWKKQLKRWFNQSEIFCNFLENKNLWKKINLITKIKNTKSQAKSTKTERLKNLKNAFKIDQKIQKNILKKLKSDENIFILIDDVLSTWETMRNCAIEIKKKFKGWKIYWFVICSDKK